MSWNGRTSLARASSRPAARFVAGGVHQYGTGWTWSTDQLPTDWIGFILGSCLDGHGELSDGQSVFPLRRGSIYFLDLRRKSTLLRNSSPQPLAVAWMLLNFQPPVPKRVPPLHAISDEPIFWEQLTHRVLIANSANHKCKADFWLNVMLEELAELNHRRPAAPRPIYEPYVGQVHQLCSEIRIHPGRRWTLSGMAEVVGVSSSHFARIFRKHQGINPIDFVLGARMSAAAGYLTTTPWPVNRIAEVLGFCDAFAFSRRFRKHFGVSPTQYRACRKKCEPT